MLRNLHQFAPEANFYTNTGDILTSEELRQSKQKIGVKKIGFRKAKSERSANNYGREFWAWIFLGGLKSWKNKAQKLAEKFAIKIRWEIRRQFS